MKEIKFRFYDEENNRMLFWTLNDLLCRFNERQIPIDPDAPSPFFKVMQYTGLKDENGKEIYEGDIVGEESVYHFLDRNGWEAESGKWKIIGEKVKNFTGREEERYIAGYKLKTVIWENSGFEPFCDSELNCGHCGGGRRSEDFEVIGNIYEHPELLTN